MKKHYLAFVALAAAAVVTSCSTDELAQQQEQNQTEPQTVTLTASVDGNNDVTRVGMTKNEDGTSASFYWHKDDKIFVQTVNNGTYDGAEFTTTETATGAESATFTGEVTGTVGQYAMYPYSVNHKFENATTLLYSFPNHYVYETVVEGNIFSKGDSYPSNSTNIPMLGTIDNGKISFRPIGGLAVIRIDKMPAEEGTITVTTDQRLWGEFYVNMEGEYPTIAAENVSSINNENMMNFYYFNATKDGVGVFYLPLATGSYSNVKITVGDNTVNCGNLYVARGSVNAIALYNEDGTLVRYSSKNADDGTYTINGHTFVDLGLPSGILWATMNVGATSSEAYGNYYAWGETSPSGYFDWGCYTYGSSVERQTKYYSGDSKTVLEAKDDAATRNWGTTCRMPTDAEFQELIDNCTWKWTSKSTSADLSVNGFEVTGKNGKSIFLPAAGIRDNNTLVDGGQGCNYWSSTLNPNGSWQALILLYYLPDNTTAPASGCRSRYRGCTVRAVAEKLQGSLLVGSSMNGTIDETGTLNGFDDFE